MSTLGFHELPDSFRLAMHCDCCSSTSTPNVAAERHNRRPHEAAEEHSRDFIIGAAAMRSMSSSKQQEEGAAATAGVHAQESIYRSFCHRAIIIKSNPVVQQEHEESVLPSCFLPRKKLSSSRKRKSLDRWLGFHACGRVPSYMRV